MRWNVGGPGHPSRQVQGEEVVLGLAAVYSCVRYIADAVASLPVNVYRRLPDGTSQKLTYSQLLSEPSAVMGQYDWTFQAMSSVLLHGTSWGLITGRTGVAGPDGLGLPSTVEWLPANRMSVVEDVDQPWNIQRAQIYFDGRRMNREELVILRAFTVPGKVEGISPMRAFATLIGQGLDALDYSASWFKNGGFPPGTFKNAAEEVDSTAAKEIRQQLTDTLRLRQPLVYGRDWEYCADAETEMLTKRGWLGYDEIREDDECLGLNPATGMSEWQAVNSVNIFDGPHEVVEMTSSTHSSVTTHAHRWPVIKRKTGKIGWTTTAAMASDDTVCRAAPVQAPVQAKWSDALVELIAWLWTEGHVRPSGMVEIEQSHAANPSKVARIRAALTDLFGPPVASLRPYGHPKPKRPAWREDLHGDMARFRLSAGAGDILTAHAPDKVVSTAWLASLTRAQLELFVQTSIDADGSRRDHGGGRIAQRSRERLDAFQVAAALAGYAGTVYINAAGMWVLELGNPWCRPVAAARQGHRASITQREFNGIVWCPTTPHENWFARRRGTTFFTGNSPVIVPTDEAVFIRAMQLNATQIAAIYGMPPAKVGGAKGDSLTYTTEQMDQVSLITDTLRPWLVRMEALYSKLLPQPQFARFDPDALLKTDLKTKYDIFRVQREMGIRTADELRAQDDLPPTEDGSGRDAIPLSMLERMAATTRAIPKTLMDNIVLEQDLAADRLIQMEKLGLAQQFDPEKPPIKSAEDFLGTKLVGMRESAGQEERRDFAPPHIRATEAERQRALHWINKAEAAGCLSEGETTERLEKAAKARNRGQLAELTKDLPAEGELAVSEEREPEEKPEPLFGPAALALLYGKELDPSGAVRASLNGKAG
jgi:phage portal protein BeeE